MSGQFVGLLFNVCWDKIVGRRQMNCLSVWLGDNFFHLF